MKTAAGVGCILSLLTSVATGQMAVDLDGPDEVAAVSALLSQDAAVRQVAVEQVLNARARLISALAALVDDAVARMQEGDTT